MKRFGLGATAVLLVAALSGCGGQAVAPSPSAQPSSQPSGVPSTLPGSGESMPPASPSGPASPPEASDQPTPSSVPGPQLAQETLARVVTSDLRIRSRPEVSDRSVKLEPLLDAPRLLFIVDGPVEASGFTWYRVVPVRKADEFGDLPFGWVAAADHDGTPWIAKAADACPAKPTDVRSLYRLNGFVALACFGGASISVRARLAQPEATCGVDIGWTIEPEWLAGTCPQPKFLVEPLSGEPLSAYSIIDPRLNVSGFNPGVDPEGWLTVRLTGRFDHPAADTCKGVPGEQPVPSDPVEIVLGCRATFVITKITAA
jgi:hypothetical protein